MIKDLIKRNVSGGVRRALNILASECRMMMMHRRGVRRAMQYAAAQGMKLHFGCGANVKPGFVNIDFAPGADLTLDLREALPFSDDSCAFIYSEHFLEHVQYPETVCSLLGECLRVLQPGGIFSAGVPDTEWPLLEYAGVRSEGYFDLVKRQWHPQWCETRMEHINFHFRQGTEHLFAYDFETLRHALSNAGFVNVRRRDSNPELDQPSWAVGTLYVDAGKPAARAGR